MEYLKAKPVNVIQITDYSVVYRGESVNSVASVMDIDPKIISAICKGIYLDDNWECFTFQYSQKVDVPRWLSRNYYFRRLRYLGIEDLEEVDCLED